MSYLNVTMIKDMRPSHAINHLTVGWNCLFYTGHPVQELRKNNDSLFKSNHLFDIISEGFNIGTIALHKEAQEYLKEFIKE